MKSFQMHCEVLSALATYMPSSRVGASTKILWESSTDCSYKASFSSRGLRIPGMTNVLAEPFAGWRELSIRSTKMIKVVHMTSCHGHDPLRQLYRSFTQTLEPNDAVHLQKRPQRNQWPEPSFQCRRLLSGQHNAIRPLVQDANAKQLR